MWQKILLLLADVFAIVCIARCLLQWAQLNFNHPLAEYSKQTTDWLIQPLRKISPPIARWDTACLLAALLTYYLSYLIILLGSGAQLSGQKTLIAALLFTLLSFTKALAYTLLIGMMTRMILSFRQPYSPLIAILNRIFQPLSQPFAPLKYRQYDFSGSIIALLLWLWISAILPQLHNRLNLWLLN